MKKSRAEFWSSVSNRLTQDPEEMKDCLGCLCFFGDPGQGMYRVDYLDEIDYDCSIDDYGETFYASYEDYWYRWCCPVTLEDFMWINKTEQKEEDMLKI